MNGIAPILELNLSESGEFISGKIHSIRQIGEGGPVPDKYHRALKEIKKLTEEDLPDCTLKIGADGTITRREEEKK